MSYVHKEARSYDVDRITSRKTLKKFYIDFVQTKNIIGLRKGGPKVLQIDEEIEFLFKQPSMSVSRCVDKLAKRR